MMSRHESGARVVTMGALIRRINRKLEKYDEQLRRSRGRRWWTDLGDFHVVNFNRNFLVQGHVDPEGFGRELGVLRDDEAVVDES